MFYITASKSPAQLSTHHYSMTEEHSCRICRGEATRKQPLIHPCKCRGSIRYIHEDCLLEWLKHSSKSTKQCDICNTQYRFKTIYDPNMPKRVPLLLIWAKIVSTVTTTLTQHLLAVLYTLFLLQLPIFWKIVGRVYTFLVDGPLPPGGSIPLLLLYGTLACFDENLPLTKDSTWFDKAVYLFFNTFLNGMVHVCAFVIMLLAIFVEHEWVVRDDGYTKMLLNDIGREPRSKLLDLLQGLQNEAQENQNGNGENAENGGNDANRNRPMPLDLVNEAIRDLRNVPEEFTREVELRNAINNGELNDLIRGQDQRDALPGAAPLPLPDIPANHVAPNEPEIDPHAGIDMENAPNPHVAEASDDSADEDYVYDGNDNDSASNLDASSEHSENNDAAWDPADMDQNLQDVAGIDRQPEELDEGILEIIGLKLNLSTPLLLTVLVDAIVMIFLFAAYLVPHMIGNLVLLITASLYTLIRDYHEKVTFLVFVKAHLSPILNFAHKQYSKSEVLVNTRFFVFDVFLQPTRDTLSRCLSLVNTGPATLPQRVVALSIGYFVSCYAICSIMRGMVSGKKPLVGNARRVYKLLFEITATAKVFIVFAVEIVVFPVYCGWLIDICLAPLFKTDLVIKNKDGSFTYEYLFIASLEHYNSPSARVLIYWGFGTIYMLCFALYVGMLRSQILRPGVLFFIRSPEDPNARLIHDALVKSLRFQMLRIWLSAKFYTGNIILGIGLVTWGLRWFTASSNPNERIFLPVTLNWTGVFYLVGLGLQLHQKHEFLARYCVKFWERVFQVVCYKLRLSDFILGTPIAEERGHIVYRSWFHELYGAVPDYQHPVTYSEARQKLKEPGVNACFVPDGNFVRAPSSDTSRKFIDQLFIPVTRADQPINEEEPRSHDNEDGYESDYSDVELNYEQSYVIVYRPPNFKTRCMLLVLLLGIFAQLLFVFVGVSALFPGRLTLKAFYAITNWIGIPYNPWEVDGSRVDILSLCMGLGFFILLLLSLDGQPFTPIEIPNPFPEAMNLNVNVGGRSAPEMWVALISHFAVLLQVGSAWLDAEYTLFGKSVFDDFQNPKYIALAIHFALCGLLMSPLYNTWLYERKEQSILRYTWGIGLVDDLIHCLVIGWFLTFAWDSVTFALASIASYVTVKALLGGIRLLEHLNTQVKNEKYVRGTAVQNVDLNEGAE